jgi:branched-chain amino acid transport system substrate-binding protein
MSRIRYFLTLLLFFPPVLWGGNPEIMPASFDSAYNLLKSGDYSEAYELFSRLQKETIDPQKTPMYAFFSAKSAYYSGKTQEATGQLLSIISNFPTSPYIPYCYFYLGNIQYRNSHFDEASSAYLDSYRTSADEKLDELLIKSIACAVPASGRETLERIKSLSIIESRRCPLLVAVGQAFAARRNFRTAALVLRSCNSPEARRLREKVEGFLREEVMIGIVLPVSGELQKYGEQILDGAILMADDYMVRTGKKLSTPIYDSKGDFMEAANAIHDLDQSQAVAAIGPLTSDETAVASAVLTCSDIPLVIPAATQGGLTDLSQTSFQLQPNLDWHGIWMAEFAIKKLGADTAAILTPTSPENLRMAEAFSERFKSLGGTILAVEYFRVKETDFGPYIRDIKGLVLSELNDSVIFINEDGDTIEAEEVPVWIDCLYIPANSDQLRQLLPQMLFYNLNAVYLGGDGWANSSVIELGGRILKKNYFTSVVTDDNESAVSEQFAAAFDKKYGRKPGRLESLGYDAMALICNALEAGRFTRTGITEYLINMSSYQGASGSIRFGEKRSNIELPIYSIRGGRMEKIDIDQTTGF